ncbi:hypothetical protein NBRC116188_24050 [Oceaniserpentilla sp. 4NH20-0058]
MATLLSACGSNDASQDNSGESTADMSYDVSAFLSQEVSPTSNSSNLTISNEEATTASYTSEQILRGELSATTIGGANDGNVEVFPWTVYLDADTLEASSNLTLTLDPGNYDFELLLTKGDQQYAGYSNQTLVDGANDVAMTIKPIIGDVLEEVTIIDRLAFFKFQYSLDDLAAIATPSIGIQVDGDAEQLFTINAVTGLSDTFVNLPTGTHTLTLKFYEAGTQVGKSIAAQETQTVAFGTDLAMDIVPLHGEMQLVLTEDGGDANLSVIVPAEVVDEVGGTNNLTATLALVGVKNPLQESALLFIDQGNGTYQADIVLTDLQYEDVTLSMTFEDTATTDQIASCNNTWTINNQSQSFLCNITLIRRAVVSSNILAVLGLNVFNEAGEPVSGAVVTNASGDTLGITGSGVYGTAGYLKVYVLAGDHDITATDLNNSQAQTATVSLSPLEVENVQLTLEDIFSDAIGFTGDFDSSNWTVSGVASTSIGATQVTATVGGGGGGTDASITIPANGTINFDWAMNVYSAGQYGDSIQYFINGTAVVLSSAGSASGSETNIAVQAGDTFGFRTWGTTSSSSYQAVYNNFSYIVD